MIPVKDHDGLARGRNGVIHNTDQSAYRAYIENRQKILDEEERLTRLENQVANIQDALGVIIKMLEK